MRPDSKAIAIIASAIVVVSFAAILIRLCTVPTAVIAAYRLSLASLILLPFFLKTRGLAEITPRQIGLCMLAGLFLSLHFLFWIESLRLTTVASSVVLVTTSPIFTAVFAWLALRESIRKRTIIAIALCVLGSLTISTGDIRLEVGMLRGDVYALMGAAMFGAYFVTGRSVRGSLSHLQFAFMGYTASAVMLVCWAAIRGHRFAGFEPINYLWFVLLAAGPQVFGHTSLIWALRYVAAPKVAVSVLGEPIGSALLAWLFFAEVPGYAVLAGGVLILCGVYLALSERPRD